MEDSVSPRDHAREPIKKLRVHFLLTSMGDHHSFGPELHLLFATNDCFETACPAAASPINQLNPDVLANCCRHYFTIWKQLDLSDCMARVEYLFPQVLVDVL